MAGVSRPLIGVDGTIFPCERVSETSSCMKIGSVFTGFDVEQSKKLLNICEYTIDECKDCWAISFCEICAKLMDDNGQLSRELKLKACESAKLSAVDKLKAFVLFDEYYRYY